MNPTIDGPSGHPGSKPPLRPKRHPGRPRIPRKPKAGRFPTQAFQSPDLGTERPDRGAWGIAALIASGILLGVFWPQHLGEKKPKEEVYVMQEPAPAPAKARPPEPPPPPPPPKVKAPRLPAPPKQFGLQKEALAEKSDLAVATGNTVNTKADSIVAPPPPALPPEPVLVDQPPRVLSGPSPEYPARARDRGQEGTVVALITIDVDGQVIHAQVEKSAGTDFDKSVMKSVWATRFEAPVRNGKRVPTLFRRPYEFRLDG